MGRFLDRAVTIYLWPGRRVEASQAKTAKLRAAGICLSCEQEPAETGRDRCYECYISDMR